MFVDSNANTVDFREKAFPLFSFLCIANLLCLANSHMGGLLASGPPVFSGMDYLGLPVYRLHFYVELAYIATL